MERVEPKTYPAWFYSEERCELCRFWDDDGDDEDAKPRTGGCHRYPPQRNRIKDTDTTPVHTLWSFPKTGGHWGCGEFKAFTPNAQVQPTQGREENHE